MRYGRSPQRATMGLGFNATPMVDVIFMLTIFFMLVTRFSSAEQVPMELPQPDQSKAKVGRMPERVVVNCRLADPTDPDSGEALYSIGPNQPESLDLLADRLRMMRRELPAIKVVVRADRRLPYATVREVMGVIAECGVEVLNVVAHVSEDE